MNQLSKFIKNLNETLLDASISTFPELSFTGLLFGYYTFLMIFRIFSSTQKTLYQINFYI